MSMPIPEDYLKVPRNSDQRPASERDVRRRVAVNHALDSDNPVVKDMLDRLIAVTEMVHGEEIAAVLAKIRLNSLYGAVG